MTDLTHIEELEKKATPGPWSDDYFPNGQFTVHPRKSNVMLSCDLDDQSVLPFSIENTKYLTALRNAAPGMIEEIKRLRAEQEWHPIETAPRDGTVILGYRFTEVKLGSGHFYEQCHFNTNQNKFLSSGYSFSPTHWKPLPQPPKV